MEGLFECLMRVTCHRCRSLSSLIRTCRRPRFVAPYAGNTGNKYPRFLGPVQVFQPMHSGRVCSRTVVLLQSSLIPSMIICIDVSLLKIKPMINEDSQWSVILFADETPFIIWARSWVHFQCSMVSNATSCFLSLNRERETTDLWP